MVSWGSLALFGGLMALGGLSQMMAQTPGVEDYSTRDKADEQKSFLFNGPVNTIEQGTALPIVLGKHMIGSTVISAGMRSSVTWKEDDDTDNHTDPFTVVLQKVNCWAFGDASQYFDLDPGVGEYTVLKYADWTLSVAKNNDSPYLFAEVYVDGSLVNYINIDDSITVTISDVTCSHTVVVYCNYSPPSSDAYE